MYHHLIKVYHIVVQIARNLILYLIKDATELMGQAFRLSLISIPLRHRKVGTTIGNAAKTVGLSRRRSRVRVPSLPPFRSCRPAASIDRFRLQDPLEFKTSSKLRTIAASRGLGVAPRGVNLIGRPTVARGGRRFCMSLGRDRDRLTERPATSAPRLKAESKLIPPRDFLKGATGGSKVVPVPEYRESAK